MCVFTTTEVLCSEFAGALIRGDNMKYFTLAVSIAALAGCSYAVKPVSAPAVNVYSSYEDKIPGKWVVVVADTSDLVREIKPSGFTCSAHKYPFDAGDSIRLSVQNTLQNVFEEIELRSVNPTLEEIERTGFSGYLMIRVTAFQPRLSCSPGFWEASCTATSELAIGVDAFGHSGKLLGTSVSGSKSSDGGAGGYCGEAANIFADAFQASVKDTMERLAERVSNATKLREP